VQIAEAFLEERLIAEDEKEAIVSEAAQSDCGKAPDHRKF